ncbi:Splicing factor, putative [Pediculus humanus corporis]|uniref:Splicing factor 45 n=1 Tax=Pediculus humanus subsp. corporis TaxID=121224 RepID=E0VQK5_PEDHC|nr:Splicing factor, putative [Pediculus humanus corporis]EEB15661.1 Splicing factor, putative [Pediculus humanus corporis]
MSLYDDLEPVNQKPDQVVGWSSGIKLFQSQLQLKKAAQTQPKKEQIRKSVTVLAPVIDLKSKLDDDDSNSNSSSSSSNYGRLPPKEPKSSFPQIHSLTSNKDFDWNIVNEYDPMWPNDYEKVVKDLREIRDKEREKEELQELEKRRKARDDRNGKKDRDIKSGLSGRRNSDDDEEEERDRSNRVGGVAIAPPPSLQESKSEISTTSPKVGHPNISFAGSAVAAKIMAKYGFKEGQGLGKKEQGMSLALQVEKTSKRGGRIIHEKDIMMPPPAPNTPPMRVDSPPASNNFTLSKTEPSITEIMKFPSKVVLLRNMVGPGEVDDDLEPEVKDECNTKYGEVIKVLIFEMPDAPQDEAIRIFVEFKRIESAIKAVVDLNGRFFGGRQVKAGFYVWEKFNNLELLD